MAKPPHDWDPALYTSKHDYVHSLAADLVDEIEDWTGLRVADVGCGTGELTDDLRRRGATVVGVDASPSMIAAARERFPDLELRVGDARDLSWESELDVIFSNAALHWVPEADQVAASFAKALKPGGRVLLEMGGSGNVTAIRSALTKTLTERGHTLSKPSSRVGRLSNVETSGRAWVQAGWKPAFVGVRGSGAAGSSGGTPPSGKRRMAWEGVRTVSS